MNHTSTAYQRWMDSTDDLRITDMEEWNNISANIYKATRETKLQALHFKIIYWIIPCGTYLRQLRISQSEDCTMCGLQDSLAHFFYEYPQNKSFWQLIFRWFEGVEDLGLAEIPRKHLIMGLPQSAPQSKKINAIRYSYFSQVL